VSRLTELYEQSPVAIQNLAVTLYGVKVYRREYGAKFNHLLREFEANQWLSPAALEELQLLRLRQLMTYSFEKVPYYRKLMLEHGLTPSSFQSLSDIRKLPVLTREEVRQNVTELLSSDFKRSQLIPGRTSGTTGSPLEFYWDERACLMKNVVDWRQKGLAGLKPGDRMAFLLGRVVVPIEQQQPPFWRHNYLLRHLFFSSFHLSARTAPHYLAKLEAFQPKSLEGYPSTLFILASFLLAEKRRLPLKVVFSSSETLFPHQRETIEEAFQCKLFDFYGMAERVVFATECETHNGKHLNVDFGLTEVLTQSGEPAAPGELGRIVATGFFNFGMPLIRYQTSDVTAIQPAPCSCGRTFPMMENVTTKAEDIITTKDGRYISSSILTHPFKPLHSIAESQIIQEDRDHITVKIVRRENFTPADEQFLLTELKKRLGEGIELRLEYVTEIPRTSAGKFRWVISKVPLEF